MADETNETKPCPFCGSNDTAMCRTVTFGEYYADCRNCDAVGGYFKTRAEAIETWNRASLAVERER